MWLNVSKLRVCRVTLLGKATQQMQIPGEDTWKQERQPSTNYEEEETYLRCEEEMPQDLGTRQM